MADATDPYDDGTEVNYDAKEDKDRTGDTGQEETDEPDEADQW